MKTEHRPEPRERLRQAAAPLRTILLVLAGASLIPVSAALGQGGGPGGVPVLFHTADQCMACHNQLTAPDGQDVSIGFNWRSSMMGNSARDPGIGAITSSA